MLQFRILGPLEVESEGGLVELGGQRQRLLLAVLLLRANEAVSTDSLLHAVWGDAPPRTAKVSLQNGISRLRKLLGPVMLETRPHGYRLRVAPDQLDAVEFDRLVQTARSQAPEERARTLTQALALWRGEPLADMTFEAFAQGDIRRLAEGRLVARIERIDAELENGRHADLVAEIEGLLSANPLDERLTSQLMVALYRCGRQAAAMQAFQTARTSLDAQLGQPPGAALQKTYREILQHARVLEAPLGAAQARDARFNEIARAALASRLVPVLGPALEGAASPLHPAAAASHLAQRFEAPPEHAGSLARVAQWIAITQGVGPLYDALHAIYAVGGFSPGPAHRSLAALPQLFRSRGLPCQLLLTSAFDCLLEQAFQEAGEEYDVVSFVALGRDRGKFLHRGADGSARLIDEPNLEVGLAPNERTMILKLNGGTDELSGGASDSYVVSEDDYIDYLSQSDVSALLPIGLAARLRRSHLLFVGYELDEWSPRVFLRRLWGEERIAFRSWAVDARPNRLTSDQWRHLGVDVLQLEADESLEELRRRLDGDSAAGVPV